MTDDQLTIALAGKLIAFGELDEDAAYELAPVLLSVVHEYADAARHRQESITDGSRSDMECGQ